MPMNAVADAQKALDDAKASSPEVKTTFDGLLLRLMCAGDEVNKGTVAVTIADPAKFQADVLVSQMDIYNIQVGGDATVQADALSGLSFPAKITYIAPTATVSQGVVNYKVTIELHLYSLLSPLGPALVPHLLPPKQRSARGRVKPQCLPSS